MPELFSLSDVRRRRVEDSRRHVAQGIRGEIDISDAFQKDEQVEQDREKTMQQ